jgi:dienelactone hydrolase
MIRFGKSSLAALITLSAAALGNATLRMENVSYKQDTTSLEGVLVYDAAAKGRQPGIVLVPDWMGVSELAKQYAEKTAKLGTVVFIADIYGAKVRPKDMKEASTQAALYKGNRDLMQARARAAYDQLKKSAHVDTTRLAAQGYCFGGTVALELARSGAPLNGTVSFHGGLDTPHPDQAKNIKGEVLANHGADDPFVTQDQVAAFQDEMRKAGVDWRLTQYGGAVHGFTNPNAGSDNSKGMAYNAKADQRSWQETTDFYKEIFAKPLGK